MNKTVLPSPLVMLYTEDGIRRQQIAMLCAQLGIRIKELKRTDADTAVGRLAGIAGKTGPGEARAPEGYVLPELMIFSGLADDLLDRFLEAYRLSGLAPVSLKAVLTPYNFNWSLYQLAQELIRERTAMLMERR